MLTGLQTTDKKEKPCGCAGDSSMPALNNYCHAPLPMPVTDCGNCLTWFFVNTITKQGFINANNEPDNTGKVPVTIQFEITYEFSLCLKGRQPGKLLYTTSLIPQEELKIYISDRFRKTTDATNCFSVHSTFRNSVSALHESRQSNSVSSYTDNLNKSSKSGGDSVSFLGLFDNSNTSSSSSSNQTVLSLQSASQNFQQTLVAASQSVEAQRSLVISSYEDQENIQTTSRTLKNFNNCRAVTYYIRQVNEVYEFSAKIASIRWRIAESRLSNSITDWQTIDDIAKVQNEELKKLLETFAEQIQKSGETVKSDRCFTLPTDGTVLETELAHCSSCDGEKMLELEGALEKTKAKTRKSELENELLNLEKERRKKLLESGNFNLFDQPVLESVAKN